MVEFVSFKIQSVTINSQNYNVVHKPYYKLDLFKFKFKLNYKLDLLGPCSPQNLLNTHS